MTRIRVARYMLAALLGAGSTAALHAQAPVPEAAEESAATHDGMGRNHIETYLVEENFDELDRIADTFRREKTREKGGGWRLQEFYEVLDAPEKTDKDSVEHLAHLEKWVQARPRSITARVALATSLVRWAWVARGNGSANTVTPAMFALFTERAQKAEAVLEGARDLPVMCPQWFEEMMKAGVALNWNKGRMHEVLERGVQLEPDYFGLYKIYADYLLPKWFGKAGDASAFAKASADHLGGQDGDQLYFELANTVVRRGSGNESPKLMDWARVQRGYAAEVAQYGATRRNQNQLAMLAYLFDDPAVAQQHHPPSGHLAAGRRLVARRVAGQEVFRPGPRLVAGSRTGGAACGAAERRGRELICGTVWLVRPVLYLGMDLLWTPWRYSYITGEKKPGRKGVPEELEGWPGEDQDCVFCNLIRAVEWGEGTLGREAAEKAGLVVARFDWGYCCLNRYPYSSGHLLLVPYLHTDSLAKLPEAEAAGMIREAQQVETALRSVYKPNGINLGMNLGQAAGAGVAEHIHLHALPRWIGDTNFMTVVAEARVLPETLDVTWARIREALGR